MEMSKRRISCRRCQLRKLKCSRLHPCSNCMTSNSDCNFRDDDSRRRPVSRSYVAALEEQIGSYEKVINTMRQASANHIHSIDNPSGQDANLVFDYSGSSRVSTLMLLPGPQGHCSFYGPTSIYQKYCITEGVSRFEDARAGGTLDELSDVRLMRIFKVDDLTIKSALSTFFYYLGAECPFLDRAVLVQDFLANKYHGKCWSYPLVYAICCLGAGISQNAEVSKTADPLRHCAHEMLSVRALESPHMTVVQGLLCLAFAELGAGDNTKGWMLSGMAFRMIQDLGLHQDARFLADEDSTIDMSLDAQLRRKVYWGSYVADKMISLYFGRPVSLRDDEAAVDPLDPNERVNLEVPDLLQPDILTSPAVDELSSLSVLPHLADLSKIIECVMSQVFSTKLIKLPRKELVIHRVAKVEELNVRLFRWHSAIPELLAWNQWTPTTQPLAPQLTIMHALYHSSLISLNRHFIRPTPGFARKSQSREICIASADSIIAITRHYRAQHTLATAPLILVYSLIMAATAVTFALEGYELDQHLSFLLKTLRECSKTYQVARNVSDKLEMVLQAREHKRSEGDANSRPESGSNKTQTPADWEGLDAIDIGLGGLTPSWWDIGASSFEGFDVIGELGTYDVSIFEDQASTKS